MTDAEKQSVSEPEGDAEGASSTTASAESGPSSSGESVAPATKTADEKESSVQESVAPPQPAPATTVPATATAAVPAAVPVTTVPSNAVPINPAAPAILTTTTGVPVATGPVPAMVTSVPTSAPLVAAVPQYYTAVPQQPPLDMQQQVPVMPTVPVAAIPTPKELPVLFVSHFPKNLNEDSCKKMFEPYGKVSMFVLCRDRINGESKGSGFMKFERLESAERCISLLHEKYTIPGMDAPMVVRYAQPPYPDDVAAALMAQGTVFVGPAKLFIGHLPAYATEADLRPAFEKFGPVSEIIILRAGRTSKCCGFVNMTNYPDAVNASQALNNKYQLDSHSDPIVVRFADARSHGSMKQAAMNNYGQSRNAAPYGRSYAPARSSRTRQGPPGANLYVRGLPLVFSDQDLESVFAPIGDVISAKVFVDPATHEGRGFGFVSFSNVADAQRAIARMNNATIGPGITLSVQVKTENTYRQPMPPVTHGSSSYAPY